MKKYIELGLIVVATMSTALFLFYKYEYSRLRSVLEVLETFGDGDIQQTSSDCYKKINYKNKSILSTSVWQKFGSSFTYSAFAFQEQQTVKIRIIAIITNFTPRNHYCQVWFDNSDMPVKGKLSVKVLGNDGISKSRRKYQAAFLECLVMKMGNTPYAVSPFTQPNESSVGSTIDVTGASSLPLSNKNNEVHACVFPLMGSFYSTIKFAEFLAFHKAIGISHFYLYDKAVTVSMRNLMNSELMNEQFTISSWKLPVELQPELAITNLILMNDCLLRSQRSARFLLISEADKFLIPLHHSNVQAVLKDVAMVFQESSHIICGYRMFCFNFPDESNSVDDKTSLLLLKKTQWKFEGDITPKTIVVNTAKVKELHTLSLNESTTKEHYYHVPQDVMIFHWYTNCRISGKHKIANSETMRKEINNISYRFKENLLLSNIIKFVRNNE